MEQKNVKAAGCLKHVVVRMVDKIWWGEGIGIRNLLE